MKRAFLHVERGASKYSYASGVCPKPRQNPLHLAPPFWILACARMTVVLQMSRLSGMIVDTQPPLSPSGRELG